MDPWIAVVAGAALAAAFAPVGIFSLASSPRSVVPVAGREPRAAWRGFLFTAATFLAGTYWIYHSVHTIGGAPIWSRCS
jgi:apolipoprotein N-acyltransferase